MRPRRVQTPITIRSDRAAARLAILTRAGRSQADVIEDALEAVPEPLETTAEAERARRIAAIDGALAAIGPYRHLVPTMAEFDATEYDELGNPR